MPAEPGRKKGTKGKKTTNPKNASKSISAFSGLLAFAITASLAVLLYYYKKPQIHKSLEAFKEWTSPTPPAAATTTPYYPPIGRFIDVTPPPIWIVQDIAGKGKGAVAARNIKAGEEILRERPLFVVPRTIESDPVELIRNTLANLGTDEQEAFFNLSYVNLPAGVDPAQNRNELALAIFQTNGVAAGDDVGLFLRMSRLNHGCSSAVDVTYHWRDNERVLVVHALKDIPAGKEILTTYIDSKKPRSERKALLRQQYGFDCGCEVCTLPDKLSAASDSRLAEITRLHEKFKAWGSFGLDGHEAVDYIRRIWEIMDEEDYLTERGQLASDAAWIAAAHSDWAATKAWAQLAVKWFTREVGADYKAVKELKSVVNDPRTSKVWSTRASAKVGGPGKAQQHHI